MQFWQKPQSFWSTITVVLFGGLVSGTFLLLPFSNVTAQSDISEPTADVLQAQPHVTTETRFSQKEEAVPTSIPYSTRYSNDDDLEIGNEVIDQVGGDGKLTKNFRVTYYDGEEFSRELLSINTVPAQEKVIRRGTKIVVRTLETENGAVRYWQKINVYATAYTNQSAGGSGHTATGTLAHFGTVAVDPKVIPLGTKMYIPGYGLGVAEDTGGAIKGKIIDLFYEGDHGWWNARRVDIYLIAN